MSSKGLEFQPGAILHDAVVGAFRAYGGTFERWCADNGINPNTARYSTYGQSRGEQGRLLLDRIIEGAGRELVRRIYVERVLDHASSLRREAA